MIAITTRRLSREEFVNWSAEAVAGLPTLPRAAELGEPRSSDVTLVWPEERPEARPVVCVSEHQLQELFAFVSTYNTTVRPYTAYFRVIPLELIDVLKSPKREQRDEMRLARMTAGASMAEAWLASARQSERPTNVLPLLQASLSSALGQAVLAGYNDVAFDWVLRQWQATRTGQADLKRDETCEGSSAAWRHVLGATTRAAGRSFSRSSQLISDFIANSIEAKSIHPEMLSSLSMISGTKVDLVGLLSASREERISRFNATIADLKHRNKGGLEAEFFAGLLLAIAGNGSFDMIRSAREFDGRLDGAATWFGICAALFDESNILTYGNSAGRRLVRDLLRREDPFGLPSSDIGSTEFLFLEINQSKTQQLSVHGQGSIDVEILPNVVTRIPLREARRPSRSAEESESLMRTLDEVLFLAGRARRILDASEPAERQGDFYKTKGRSRSR